MLTGGSSGRRSPGRLIRTQLRLLVPYVVVMLVAGAASFLVLHPLSATSGAVLSGGGDALWLQASFQSAGQAGPFGTTPHLNWPTGFSPWSLPQLGIGLLSGAWFLVGVLSVNPAAAVLLLACVVVAVNAAAVLFLFRSLLRERLPVLACVMAVAFALSPYFFTPIAHINVAAFFLVPLVLAVLVRGRGRQLSWWGPAAALIVIVSALSPLWWSSVVLLVLAIMAVGRVVQRRWRCLVEVAVTGAATSVGVAIQLILYRGAAIPGEAATRGPWDSNVYGGHVLDFLRSSPWLDSLISRLAVLVPGTSVEFKPVGLVCALAGLAGFLILLKGPSSAVKIEESQEIDTGTLALATVTSVLLFLSGGLGGVQAGLAVLAGGESPARVWSRLSILIAMFGLAWILIYGATIQARMRGSGVARYVTGSVTVAVVLIVVTLDLQPIARQAAHLTTASDRLPERAAISYLHESLRPCPIAQLPLETAPSIRLPYGPKDVDSLMYRGYLPYLLAPSFDWSFGPSIPASDNILNKLDTTLAPGDKGRILAAGYCAILFDKSIANFASSHQVEIQGRGIAAIGKPSFKSDRYDVYVLTNA